MKNNGSEIIRCPNFNWRLFRRGNIYYADGRKYGNGKHSLGADNRKCAIEELQKLDSAIADEIQEVDTASQQLAPAIGQAMQPISVAAGWDLYLSKRTIPIHLGGLKPSSVRKYKGHRKRFVAYSVTNGITSWAQVNRSLLEKYATELDKQLAPVTIHDDLTMEISVSNWLIKEKRIPQDCKINWKLKKPPGAIQYCYERDEVSRMLELALANERFRWLHPLIFLLSHTGVRIGEALNLKWSDIDLKHGVIHIRDETFDKKIKGQDRRQVKDKESRIIPIHESLHSFLSSHAKRSGYFLPGQDGRKRSYSHTLTPFVEKINEPLRKEFPTPKGEVGFEQGRFHSFRHFFVSECFDAGIPECDIKTWVGHSESKVIALYRHIRSKTAKANMRLGKFGAA